MLVTLKRLISPFLPQISGICILVLLPVVHFGIINPIASMWTGEDVALPDGTPKWQDPSSVTCKCNCSGRLLPDNRHIHLRATSTLSHILLLSILFSFTIYELMTRLVVLHKLRELRPHFGLAVVMSFHSIYKTYWILATLYNREYFYKFYYQLMHCVLHLAQVLILSEACDKRNSDLGVFKMIVLLKVSIGRMLVVLKEQIDVYLWFGLQFRFYWLLPDCCFFLSDVLAAVVCVEELVRMADERGINLREIFLTKRYFCCAAAFFFVVIFSGEYFPDD